MRFCESCSRAPAVCGRRFGVAAIIALVMLIAGRIIPSFSQNYLARRGAGRLPKTFSRFDGFYVAVSLLALAGWIVAPESRVVGAALIVAGFANFARLSRWAGERTGGEALVAVLHVAFLFVPIGFLLSGLSAWSDAIPFSAGLHARGVGGIGGMTLAVMTRASLGHTGQALHAGVATKAIYAAVLLATLARIGAALAPQWGFSLLHVAAFSWLGAFGGFPVAYARALVRPRA